MGLDMYAVKVRPNRIPEGAVVDFEVAEPVNEEGLSDELHYWRKHPNLHGWMQRLYVAKGGKSADPTDFNCVNVLLTTDDLDALDKAISDRSLPSTDGFFFGRTDGSEYQDDLAFIAKARAAISEGYAVFYSSWW